MIDDNTALVLLRDLFIFICFFYSESDSSSTTSIESLGFMLPETLPGKSDSTFTAHLQSLLPKTQVHCIDFQPFDNIFESGPMSCPVYFYQPVVAIIGGTSKPYSGSFTSVSHSGILDMFLPF